MTATLWIPGPLPGMNEMVASAKGSGGAGRDYSALKRRWTDSVMLLARRLPHFQRASLTFTWHERERRRDPDNIASAKKLVLDGLVAAKVLPGDGWDYVAGFRDEWLLAKKAGVLVTLLEATG